MKTGTLIKIMKTCIAPGFSPSPKPPFQPLERHPPLMPTAPPSGRPGNSLHCLEKGKDVLDVERRGAPRLGPDRMDQVANRPRSGGLPTWRSEGDTQAS